MSLAVTRGSDPLSPVRNSNLNIDRSFVARRLLKNAISLISAHPRAEYMGPDKLVESLAQSKGFTEDDLAILRVSVGNRHHTLVCSPGPIWFARKFDLIELKQMAAFAERSVVLVPEAAIQRQPRLSNARTIEEACGVTVCVDQRMSILLHLIEAGGAAALVDCAGAIDHPQPYGAVLHMIALGLVHLDPGKELTPHTIVRLHEASAA